MIACPVMIHASMRGPPVSSKIFWPFVQQSWIADPTGGAPLAFPSVFLSQKGFPAHRRFALLPFALLVELSRSRASWSPQSQNGCCHLCVELNRPFPRRPFRRDLAVTRTRRLVTKPTTSLRLLSSSNNPPPG